MLQRQDTRLSSIDTHRHTSTHTHTLTHTQTHTNTLIQEQTDRQTETQTVRDTDADMRHTHTEIYPHHKETNRHTHKRQSYINFQVTGRVHGTETDIVIGGQMGDINRYLGDRYGTETVIGHIWGT